MRRKTPIGLRIGTVLTIVALGVCLWCGRAISPLEGSMVPVVRAEYPAVASVANSGMETTVHNPDKPGEDADWRLLLVNRDHPLPADYSVTTTELENGQRVDVRIQDALQEMLEAAMAEEVYPIVVSGYRTAEKQQSLLDEKIAEYREEGYSDKDAQVEAETWVAVPGTSEHQVGLAVDINADGVYSYGEEVYEWLDQNGYRFGFIRRYPPDKTAITGVSNEPWHYRYVGVETATEITNTGLCLEEYLEQQEKGNE